MTKSNKHIEIVRSGVVGLSSMSQVSCGAIYGVLSKYFARVETTIINDLADLDALVARQPDLVFLGMEHILNDTSFGMSEPHKIWLSDVLDDYGIAYTGSSQTAHELQRDKPLAKQRVLDASLTTSAFCVIGLDQSPRRKDVPLDFPLFIKPANRGGGVGIDSDSVVRNFDQLQAKVHSIHNLDSDALIEEYLPGREFSVALLKEEYSDEYLVMPIELVAPPDENGSRLLGSQVKSSNAEQALEVTDLAVKTRVSALALNAFHALGARDYGRIDIRLDASGVPHFLEANLIPSLISGYGSFPKACALNNDLEYEAMIMRIAELGLVRSGNISTLDLDTALMESLGLSISEQTFEAVIPTAD